MQLVGLGVSAQAYLTAFAAELASLGVDVPEAVYVAAGEIPWDGESLVISLGMVTQGVPGRNLGTSLVSPSMAISFATLNIELIREVSTLGVAGGVIQLPTDEAMATEGVTALNDAGAMTQAAINLKAQGIPVPLGVDYSIGQCVPLGPMGGLAAVRLEISSSIDGSV